MRKHRIGVVGAGVMGEALIRSLQDSGMPSTSITIVEKKLERREYIRSKYSVAGYPISECDVVFIVVKPQDFESTLSELATSIGKEALIISFIAGKTCEKLESKLAQGQRVVRAMPNTPVAFGKGFTALSKGANASDADIKLVRELLSRSGLVVEVEEKHLGAITALSGSGPAYFFFLVEAMSKAGQSLGLDEKDSLLAAQQVLIGAAEMLEKSGKDSRTLREEVTSPNGTTAAALASFESSGWEEIVYEAMKAAKDRSEELSN